MVKKISIIGAGGVGSNLAFTILNNINIAELVLVDIKKDQAKAVAFDLEDTRGGLGFSTGIRATKNYSRIKNSDIIVFSAGISRRKGMSRLDLLRINADIARDAAAKIKKYSPGSIVIAITNPLDIITYTILKKSGFPRRRVLGMGSSLDTSRLGNILWQKYRIAAVPQQDFVAGPHSKEMVVSFGRNCPAAGRQKNNIRKAVKSRGAKIVELFKNKSAVFGPALAGCKLIEAIAFDKNQVIPVSILLKGEAGLRGLCLGMPCRINRLGAVEIMEDWLKAPEKAKLKKSAVSLKKTIKNLRI